MTDRDIIEACIQQAEHTGALRARVPIHLLRKLLETLPPHDPGNMPDYMTDRERLEACVRVAEKTHSDSPSVRINLLRTSMEQMTDAQQHDRPQNTSIRRPTRPNGVIAPWCDND
jgi:hypothetical protein